MDRDRKNPVNVITGEATQPMMTPDGSQVLYLKDHTLYNWSRLSGETHRLTSDLNVLNYTLAPDGQQILLLAR